MDTSKLKALSDGTRLTIISLLSGRVYCVKALALKLNMSEPAVSQHLKVLRDADLVEGLKFGYYTHYRLNRAALAALGQELIDTAREPIEEPRCDARDQIGCKTRPTPEQAKKQTT